MVLGNENTKWGTVKNISPYHFQRKTWGWGTAFPTRWYPGGHFCRTDENALYMNINPSERAVLVNGDWVQIASTQEFALGLIIAIGGSGEF